MRRRVLVLLAALSTLLITRAMPEEITPLVTVPSGALTRLVTGGATGPCAALVARGNAAAQIRFVSPESGEAVLELLRADSGELLASRPLPQGVSPYGARLMFLESGDVALTDVDSLGVWLLDAGLREVLAFSPPDPSMWYAVYADRAGQYAYYGGVSGVTRFRLSDGSRETVDAGIPAGWMFSHFAGEADGGALCVYTGPDALSLLLHARPGVSSTLRAVPAGFGADAEGTLISESGDEAFVLLLPDTATLHRVNTSGGLYIAQKSGAVALMQSFGEPSRFLAIDLAQSRILADFSIPKSSEKAWCEESALGDGFALLAFSENESGAGSLYRWDFPAHPSYPDAGVRKLTLAQLREEHDALAASIASRHGVGVFIREAGAAFRDDAYQGEPSRDEVRLGGALSQLAAFLDALPPGMLARAAVEPIRRINFYLCGAITPRGASSIASAAGFLTRAGEEAGIVLSNFGPGMSQLLAHEFMHLLEDNLWRDAPADLWVRIGPRAAQGNQYAYSYHNPDGSEYGDTRWTLAGEESAEGVWFIDGYSRTYPLEDRARIFENLYAALDGTESVFTNPHLLDKARALCALLRRAFPEIEAAGGAPWERFLAPMSGEELDAYLGAFDEYLVPVGRAALVLAA